MTTKELLALVADWRRAAHQLRGDSEPMPASAMRLDECADELEAALPALCAEVEALVERVRELEGRRTNDCGHECHIIGGPFIAEDPDCPVHGCAARSRNEHEG